MAANMDIWTEGGLVELLDRRQLRLLRLKAHTPKAAAGPVGVTHDRGVLHRAKRAAEQTEVLGCAARRDADNDDLVALRKINCKQNFK